jgi:hypothetical protein
MYNETETNRMEQSKTTLNILSIFSLIRSSFLPFLAVCTFVLPVSVFLRFHYY